ncbi:MAG TPA: polyprenol monophosphomannose synthase [Tepidisphaeraceae bacterium]|nr:polyprenol monophosphomannose synthase [Tepidisphaeraceae bacterium]
MSEPQVSIIIPTLNEAENLPVLVPRIDQVLRGGGMKYEVIVVDDDSRDDTRAVCARLSEQYPLALIVRQNIKDGLSGAVLQGMAAASGRTLVVMDADLQHPPEKIPELVDALDAGADFAIGSRYVPGGSTAQRWSPLRKVNSWAATFLARPFAGRTHDPMSGFFALRRQTYLGATRLTPLGYKIALELMCKARVRDVREVPIHFGMRERGQSKLTLKQQFRYLEHLSRLYDFTFPRASPIVKFLIGTAAGWALAGFVYGLMLAPLGMVRAAIASYPIAVAVTALFHVRYVRTQREFLVTPHPWRDFWIIALAEWVACAVVAAWWVRRALGPTPLEVLVLSFGAATIVRYMLRKEFLQDVRGLRRELRKDELIA